jgi:cyanate permease
MTAVTDKKGPGKYRWYVLALIALTAAFVMAVPTMCMPVLFKEISEDLDLSLVQIGMVWGFIPLAGTFVVLIGGLVSDRIGAKRMLAVCCILTGLAGALRGVSPSFAALSATMFLYGLLQTLTGPGMIKALSTWFADEHLALANGILSVAMALGFMVTSVMSATVLSPLLGGWRNVLYLYGVFSIVVGLLWLFSRGKGGASGQPAEDTPVIPFRDSLRHVFHLRQVWLLALLVAGQIACVQGALGYLPVYLRNVGWVPAAADSAQALFHGASMVGTIPIALLSGKIGSRKMVLLVAMLVTIVGVGMLALSSGPLVWAAVLVAGVVRDGFMAVYTTMVIEAEGVGKEYSGTAISLTFMVSRLAEFFSPPAGNSLGTINPRYPFIFWAAIAAAALSVFPFLREKKAGTEAGLS